MRTKRLIYPYILVFFVSVLWMHCANPVAPSGGPKDLEPPVVMLEEPLNRSVNFKKDRIILTFDEFVELKDARNQILFSPPLEKAPDYRSRGHSVIIRFQDSLRSNTTYNIFFGNAIVDLTEGNPLAGYRYVFSTGPVIDSLSIQGQVQKAFNLEPQPDVFVMLYLNNNDTLPFDSLPFHVKPAYLGKTTENGVYSIENLRNEEYKIFTLKDVNGNLLYDLPNEEIAFMDSLISPEYIEVKVTDTLLQDTVGMDASLIDSLQFQTGLADTIAADSLVKDTIQAENFRYLYLFDEIDSTQKILEAKILDEHSLLFVFAFPAEAPKLEVINHRMDTIDWKIADLSAKGDSVRLWMKKNLFDTLRFKISVDTSVLDTIDIVFREKKEKKKDEEELIPPLRFKTNAQPKIDLDVPLRLKMQFPLLEYDFSEWKLIVKEDTMDIEPFFDNPEVKRYVIVEHEWEEGQQYQLFYPDSVLTDLIGAQNDTTRVQFTAKSLADYGILRLNFQPSEDCSRYIIQLMNEDESRIFDERIVDTAMVVEYKYLEPGKYKLKAICDSRENGRWDTGDYMKGLQPEKVYYFPKLIDLRANWEIEETWSL